MNNLFVESISGILLPTHQAGYDLLKSYKDINLWHMFEFELNLLQMAKMYRAEVQPDVIRQINRMKDSMDFNRILLKLKSFGTTDKTIDTLRVYEDIWDLGVERVYRFYEHAGRRSQDMLQKTYDDLLASDKDCGVMMVGGFHWPYLERQIQRDEIVSFMTITPQVGASIGAGYHELMKKLGVS